MHPSEMGPPQAADGIGREEPLRILHLEDEPRDAELVRAELEDQGLECEIELVATRPEFVAALDRGGKDLILSDFNLPAFDGPSALRIACEKAPEVPFVFVSGALGEEAAIESLRSGATDYVLKHHLSRLGPAVRRALREADERRRLKRAEQVLKNEKHFLKALLESLEAGIVACDSQGVLTMFNRATREFHGLPEKPLPPDLWAEHYGLFHADGKTPLEREAIPLFRALQGERVRDLEVMIVPRDREARRVLVSGQPIIDDEGRRLGAVAAIHDVTELKQLEVQLRQAQKMEAIGRLAGGIAHDFNNLLSVLTGYSEMLLADPTMTRASADKVQQIMKAAERAANLTRQLLAFSRKQIIEPRVLDLNMVLSETEKMLRRVIGEDIDLTTSPAKDLGRVRADPGQIEQILMNLVVNARDAMPGGGTLRLETANVDLDEAYVRGHAGARPGRYVMLSVSDSGVGMDSQVRARLFEPFFTTKPPGKGTGLGLATVYGIVKQNEGYIWVDSEPGHGSRFTIYLRRVEEAPETLAPRDQPTRLLTGHETVLVAEDEQAVRNLAAAFLRGQGYTVVEASHGEEALRISERHEGSIDLLLTDVVMPGMSGLVLAERLRHLRPELRVIYMSGHTDEAVFPHGAPEGGVAFLQKPFALPALARKLRELLDSGPAVQDETPAPELPLRQEVSALDASEGVL